MMVEAVGLGESNPMLGTMWSDLFKTKQETVFDAIQLNNPIYLDNKTGDIFGIVNRQEMYELEKRERAGFLQAMFLQYPNEIVRELALSIVSPNDSNDIKAHKLHQWVAGNIDYKLDSEEYGMAEVWQPPVITIQKGTGDCEDQALLLHSLMLNAGIPSTRIRTYGGYVDDQEGTSGGHAWTAYKLEATGEWVILDTTFHPNLSPVNSLPLMKDSDMYEEDYFFITLAETVYTIVTDRIHNPDILPIYGKTAKLLYNTQRAPGMWLNAYA